MALSRAQALWRYLQPPAAADGIVAVRPEVDAIDLRLRAKIQDLKDLLDIARARVLALEAALDGKAPLDHVHPIAQVTNLSNILNNLQTRVTALEAKVP